MEERTGRRARDRKQDVGCPMDSREPTDSEREARKISSVRSGFIPPGPRNWTGPRRESLTRRRARGAAVLYICGLSSRTKEDVCERLHAFQQQQTATFELINQSITQLRRPEGQKLTEHPFVIGGRGRGGALPCPQRRGKSATPRLIKRWK